MANQPKKYKKFVATAATATLVASAIVPVASAASLTDIAGNTHEEAIKALVDAKVINGYADGTFKPNQTLTRSDVVKLLGKYLVSQGHSIPTDAVTNPRFNDLTSKSNKELLEYAAVVADAGVFAGSNGKLLAADQITRENMAIVLVRMINTLKDVSLEEFVGSQNFNGDVKDLNVAKAEARTAIQVLDFYDITNPSVANFNPKGNTTRGQFATFLHKTINADFSGAAATTGTVKAINNTTVEVTFAEDVEDIKALDFKIEGLEVSNAVVKQTDKKTVVLTTAAQKAGTEYTVTVNGNAVGKFTGVSAVVPTKVELVSSSVQGKLGQQVSVQAKVTVAEGQSKAGIPVTFNVPGKNDAVLPTVTGEAITDENGVATYTYTRYNAAEDQVTAYATGDRSKFAIGYVFWGVDTILAIEEVTTGATINNGANKTYKVTYKNPTTGKPVANKTLNVSALENINVTADKLQNVTINGVAVAQLSNNTKTEAAQITTDSKGEATFTVSGTNAEVTPVVFEAHNTVASGVTTLDKKYDASDLQTTAAKVKFAAIQAEYTIDVKREGGEVAATGEANGREYKVIVKDKAGNVAKNETVNVAFNEDLDRVIATNTKAKFVNADTDTFYPATSTGNTAKQISVKTDDKGEATFVIATDAVNENDYATPIAWIDINNANAKQGSLDEGEPTFVAPISHFQAPYLDGAKLVAKKDGAGKAITKFDGADKAVFSAELVNQSNKVFTAGYSIEKVTYTVFNTGSEDVIVDNVVISPNRSESFTKSGSLTVESVGGKSTSVRVVATGTAKKDGKDFIFTAKETTATFTNSAAIGSAHSGFLASYNTEKKTIKFVGKDSVKYAGAEGKTYEYYGVNGAPLITAESFILSLEAAIAEPSKGAVYATYKTDGDVVKFYLERTAAVSGTAAPSVIKENTTPTPGVDGTIAFTQGTAVNYTQNLTIRVTDSDLNASTTAVDTTTVTYTLTGGLNAGTHTITLTETGANTGVFEANILAALYQGATSITAKYVDAKTAALTSQERTATASISQVVGALSAGTFTQAVPSDVAAVYTSRVIPADQAFATGDEIAIDVDGNGSATTVALAGKTGAQGVAEAITAAVTGVTVTVVNNAVVITSNSVGTSSEIDVTASNVSFFNVTTVNGAASSKATYAFDINNALAAGEKLAIGGVEYTFTTTTATAQAAELVTLAASNPTFTITNPSGAKVLLTAKAAGTITKPVVEVK